MNNSPYRTINVRKGTYDEIRIEAAHKGKTPGIYATEILDKHLSRRRKNKTALAK